MGLVHPRVDTSYKDVFPLASLPAEERKCFYCRTEVEQEKYIVWHGPGGLGGRVIVLHYACTIDLTIRLMRDVHQAQCLGDLGA